MRLRSARKNKQLEVERKARDSVPHSWRRQSASYLAVFAQFNCLRLTSNVYC